MKNRTYRYFLVSTAVTPVIFLLPSAYAQGAAGATQDPALVPAEEVAEESQRTLGNIIVTAQKREQRLNDVGLSVQAIGAEAIADRGITETADLVKLVPGFTYTPSPYASEVFTLRGVGLYDNALAAAPSVSVYLDEVPLAFPYFAKAAALDVERVEVLKGPQGTLFGQSSTGGAVNFIAAKPTDTFRAGANTTINAFGGVELGGYLSGPIAPTLNGRIALKTFQGGAWQESTSRDDKLGDRDLAEGRILLDWVPSDRLKVSLNVNGYRDQSDPLAPSLIRVAPTDPSLIAPGFDLSVPASGSRDADWPQGYPMLDNSFWQVALRGDYELGDSMTVTSISSYQDAGIDQQLPFSGTPFPYQNLDVFGNIRSYNQELRLSGDAAGLNWLFGGSYEYVNADDHIRYDQSIVSNRQPIPFVPAYNSVETALRHSADTYAVFANLEYVATDALTVRGGVRYTNSEARGTGCSFSDDPGNELGQLFEVLQSVVKGSAVPSAPGDCLSLDENFDPSNAALDLEEDNVSWRVGADYKLANDVLLYGVASRGYKAGMFPNVAASRVSQYAPAVQEKLDAFEVGFKAPLARNLVQLNGSAFYYDYTDKQFRGTVLDPVFGKLEREINIPKSEIMGAELEILAEPVDGLRLSGGATYLDTKVTDSFQTFTSDGDPLDAKGSRLPFAPEWQIVADGEYAFAAGDAREAFIGAGLTYHSGDNSSLRTSNVGAPEFDIDAYTLVDLRAGIGSEDGRWRAMVFVKNLGDETTWNTVFRTIDTFFRYQGAPRTAGVSLRLEY
ncbi:TonB-dependent receptor [Hyphomonas oceanitis]